ncbi:hypothetical protein B0H11DRAFT_1906892 [Mycena galericulata]|nr:hypothetical protein B0H11DRAFT_1906892 [Mycena galericulata]
MSTPIPFSLHIVTESKVHPCSDRPEEKNGKPLFPAPPTRFSELTQVLCRQTEVRVRGRTRHVNDSFDLQGIQDPDNGQMATQAPAVQATVDEPEWIPNDDKDRGIWRRTVHFNSVLMLPFSPTFKTQSLDWQYTLQFVVPFPGIGNDLKIQTPLHLSAALGCPPPVGIDGTSSITCPDVLPAPGPSLMLDLPL